MTTYLFIMKLTILHFIGLKVTVGGAASWAALSIATQWNRFNTIMRHDLARNTA